MLWGWQCGISGTAHFPLTSQHPTPAGGRGLQGHRTLLQRGCRPHQLQLRPEGCAACRRGYLADCGLPLLGCRCPRGHRGHKPGTRWSHLAVPRGAPAGPSMSIDTACSSSLTATHLLRGMLLEGRCAQGLVTAGGGAAPGWPPLRGAGHTPRPAQQHAPVVRRPACSAAHAGPCHHQHAHRCCHAGARRALQDAGRRGRWVSACWVWVPRGGRFLASVCPGPGLAALRPSQSVLPARRYVRGEACVTLGLSLVAAGGAPAAHEPAAVVVAGAAVNQDGRSSSLTAPNGPSQQQVCGSA